MEQKPNFPYEIDFPDFPPSPAVETDIENYLAKIDHYFDGIIFCHVSVRAPHKRQRNHVYHIHIHLKVPGEDIFVSRDREKNFAHSDIHVAIRDAFRALQKQIDQRRARLKRQDVAIHSFPHAIIKSFDPNNGYGFLVTPEGREIYFHKNALVGQKTSDLKSGMEVRFNEELGENGPQVTSMTCLGRMRRDFNKHLESNVS